MAERATTKETKMRIGLLALACLATIAAALALTARPADAIAIHTFTAEPSLSQAGGHPDLVIKYSGETRDAPATENPCQCNDPKEIKVSTPTGFIANPHATPQCKAADFARLACPADSQVGVMDAVISNTGGLNLELQNEPIYNSVPRSNQPGLLSVSFAPGFFSVPFYVGIDARTGSDYGLDADANGLERGFVVQRFTMTLWGVPADESHTPLRRSNLESYHPTPSNSPHIPFLINPGTCNEATRSTVTVVGYDGSVNTATDPWPQGTGCDQLTFNPSLSARPTTTDADSASGVDIDLTVPQLLSPSFPSPSELRETTVTLPEGFSINPNAADGKTSCSDVEASFGTEEEARCPEFSKVGTDVLNSSALPEPIEGGIYLGNPEPGNRYRIFLTADGYGTNIKLAGSVRPDPQTGQLVTSFENLPQSPLTEFDMHFFGAERGLLATPTQCGTYAVHSTFVPWDELLPSQSATQFFSLDSGPEGTPCPGSPRPFNPSFSAASDGNAAGAHSPFTVDLERNDGDQNLSGLTVSLPPGFSATLAGVPYCSDRALTAAASPSYPGLTEEASPSCSAASQIGSSVTGAGAGTHPVYLPGEVYLAGPYKGAPLSLAVITPAVSGPYDLGNVVVRAAIEVNPVTAQVTAVSDPLPQILEGIPLRLRSIRVNLDRPDFALNPTNCDPFAVKATIDAEEGARANRESHYQVANCSTLPFAPKLALKLKGGTKRDANPALNATLTAKPGEANIASTVVTMPHSIFLDNAHIKAPCTRVQYAANACPTSSLLGTARAESPLLGQPLEGPVYLRSNPEHELPDLVADLKGQFNIELSARIDSVQERLRTSFETVPDVPVSKFTLNLLGGRKGLLVNSANLCQGPQKASLKMGGQNGALLSDNVKIATPCGSKGKEQRRQHLRRPLEAGKGH